MSTCLLCSMLARERVTVRELLLASLTRDASEGSRPYLRVEVPSCPDHDAVPVVLGRVPGRRPAVGLYDEEHPGLFPPSDASPSDPSGGPGPEEVG